MSEARKAADPEPSAPGADQRQRLVPAPRWAAVGIFLILAVHGVAYARAFLMPVVLALLLALVFGPLRRFLSRRGLPSGVAALLIVGALLAGLSAGVLTLAAPATQWIDDAPSIGREIREKLSEMRGATEGVREAARQVEEMASGEARPEPGTPYVQRVQVVERTGMLSQLALTVPQALAQVMFTLILLFFLLASGDMFYEKIVHVMPTFHDKRTAVRIAHDIERKLSRYLSTITLINAGLGVAVGLAFWALGMPNPALFAVVAALLNFIPYLGALCGVAIAFAVGLVSLEHADGAIIAASAYLALTAIEGQFVTPYFVGRSLQLNTVVVFVSVTLWAWLWSVVGMLVAMPLLVALRTLCEHIPALQGFGHFLSAQGAERADDEDAA